MLWFKRKPQETLPPTAGAVGLEPHISRTIQSLYARKRLTGIAIANDLAELQSVLGETIPNFIIYSLKDEDESAAFRQRARNIPGWGAVGFYNLVRKEPHDFPPDSMIGGPQNPSAGAVITPVD